MKKKKFIVSTKYTFSGIFEVLACDTVQAREHIQKHCGLVLGGTIHSTLDSNTIQWNFNVHPECTIVNIKKHIQ